MSAVRAEATEWPRTFSADQLTGTGYGSLTRGVKDGAPCVNRMVTRDV